MGLTGFSSYKIIFIKSTLLQKTEKPLSLICNCIIPYFNLGMSAYWMQMRSCSFVNTDDSNSCNDRSTTCLYNMFKAWYSLNLALKTCKTNSSTGRYFPVFVVGYHTYHTYLHTKIYKYSSNLQFHCHIQRHHKAFLEILYTLYGYII